MCKPELRCVLSGLCLSASMALAMVQAAHAHEVVRGKDLMTPEEQAEHRAQMQGLTPEQLQAYRQQHHAEMQQRAEAQGKTLPPVPAAGYGYRGFGYGYPGYGYGGMGPGYGYGYPGMGRGYGYGYGMPGYGPYGGGGYGRAWGGAGRGPCARAGVTPPPAAPAAPTPGSPAAPSKAPAQPATSAPSETGK
jgi:hypothetical protein